MRVPRVTSGFVNPLRLAVVLTLAAALFLLPALFLPAGVIPLPSLVVTPILVWLALFLGASILAPAWTPDRRTVVATAVYVLIGLIFAFAVPGFGAFSLLLWPPLLFWLGMCGAGWWCPFN